LVFTSKQPHRQLQHGHRCWDAFANTADANTATGAGALLKNTTGANTTAIGVFALFDKTTGDSNTATGLAALGDNTTGSNNTADGANALLSNTTGFGNVATGFQVNPRRKRSLTSSRFSRARERSRLQQRSRHVLAWRLSVSLEVSNQSYSDARQLCIGGNSGFDLTGSTIPPTWPGQRALSIFLDTPSAFLTKRFASEKQ